MILVVSICRARFKEAEASKEVDGAGKLTEDPRGSACREAVRTT